MDTKGIITKDLDNAKCGFIIMIVDASWSGCHMRHESQTLRCTACQCIYDGGSRINVKINKLNITLCKSCQTTFMGLRNKSGNRINQNHQILLGKHIDDHKITMTTAKATAHNKLAMFVAYQPHIFSMKQICIKTQQYCDICSELISTSLNCSVKMGVDKIRLIICRSCELGVKTELVIVRKAIAWQYCIIKYVGTETTSDILPQICHYVSIC